MNNKMTITKYKIFTKTITNKQNSLSFYKIAIANKKKST